MFSVFLLTNVLEQALHAGGILWLSDWSDTSRLNKTNANDEASFRLGVYRLPFSFYMKNFLNLSLGIYSALSFGEAMFQIVRDVVFYLRCATAAKLIHEALLNGVIRSPMQFFDTNPLGRIINRFSSDIDTMEMMIPFQLADFIWCLFEVITTFIMISAVLPIFMTVVIPIILIFFIVQRCYIKTSRQLKRIYSITKSPIFSHFSETVSGAQIIRAFKVSC